MDEVILDTNILVRFFIQDSPAQYQKAKQIIEKVENKKIIVLISILVVNELIWILENYYELKRNIYIPKLLTLLALNNLKIIEEDKKIIINILKNMQLRQIDFTDYYLISIAKNRPILSFDKDLKIKISS